MPRLDKGRLYCIYKNQVEQFLEAYISEAPRDLIHSIFKICFNRYADAVFLFMNMASGVYACKCYMPIFDNEDTLGQSEGRFYDIQDCIALTPRILDVENISDKMFSVVKTAATHGYWNKEYAISIFNKDKGKGLTKMETLSFSGIKITKETVAFEREQLDIYTRLVNKHPDNLMFKKAQLELVRMIEDDQKLYEAESGFTKLQYEIHDIALRLKNVVSGKFDAFVFEPIIEMVNGFMKLNYKSTLNNFFMQVSALASTSAVLFVDIVPKDDIKPEIAKSLQQGRAHLRKTIKAVKVLTRQGDAHDRVTKFCKTSDLDPDQAREIIKSVQKIFPKSTDTRGPLEIYSQDDKPIITFTYKGLDYFNKAKKDLDDSLKPIEANEISGFLGQLYGWESEQPRFVIETDEKRRLTIRYDKEKTDEVKQRFKTNVTLERIKEGKGWRLVAWK